MMPLGFPVCADRMVFLVLEFQGFRQFSENEYYVSDRMYSSFSLLSRLDGKTRNCQGDPARRVVERQLSLDYVRLP